MFGFRTASPAPALGDIVARVAKGEITLVDIRDPGEIAMSGAAEGAIRIPLSVFRMQADPRSPEKNPALSPDKPVALYCASGARASMAKGVMQQMGYKDVTNLGGLSDWARAGGRVIR